MIHKSIWIFGVKIILRMHYVSCIELVSPRPPSLSTIISYNLPHNLQETISRKNNRSVLYNS